MRLKHPGRMSRAPAAAPMTKKEKESVGEKIHGAKKRKDRRLGGIMDQLQAGRRRK